jgi:hypothetical protein
LLQELLLFSQDGWHKQEKLLSQHNRTVLASVAAITQHQPKSNIYTNKHCRTIVVAEAAV